MSGQNNSDDDLTTDAIPSPPRDEIKNNENGTEPEQVDAKARQKTKAKAFRKARKPAPTAFASVINISNANGIHIGSNYNVYLNNKKETSPQKPEYVVTDAIQKLFSSTQPVEREHLIFVSPHLNEGWRDTARLLEYSDGQISQFFENHCRSGIKEVIYQLLLDWIQNEADAATVGRLSKTLWDTSQQDAVQRWADNFKKT